MPKHNHISVYIHGHRSNRSFTAAYNSWRGMKQRCGNPNAENYKKYGGKGITYDPRWEQFEPFYMDMGDPPTGYQLDRKDPEKNYNLENCRWLPAPENARRGRKKRA